MPVSVTSKLAKLFGWWGQRRICKHVQLQRRNPASKLTVELKRKDFMYFRAFDCCQSSAILFINLYHNSIWTAAFSVALLTTSSLSKVRHHECWTKLCCSKTTDYKGIWTAVILPGTRVIMAQHGQQKRPPVALSVWVCSLIDCWDWLPLTCFNLTCFKLLKH